MLGLTKTPPALCHSQTIHLVLTFPCSRSAGAASGGDEFQRCSCRWKDGLANRCL